MSLLDQAEAAIQGFYHCENSQERNNYHRWLLDLQQSKEAWTISWMLLDPTKSVECQYYGVVILHFKICHMINEVTKGNLQELKSKLLSMVVTFKSLTIVFSKLCATFAALVIQIGDEDFKLGNFLCDVEAFIKSAGIEPQCIILKLLTELPSQFKFINMVSRRKIIVRMFMNEFVPSLVLTCQSIMQSQKTEFQVEILDCVIGWVEFGVSIMDCINIIPILLTHMDCEELSEKVCEVLSELLTAPSSFNLHSTIFKVLKQLLQLQPLLDKARSDENLSFQENVCKLFCNLGETHSNMFIKVKENEEQLAVLNLVKIILSFSSTPGYYPVDENCSSLTLNFWYTLQDDLFSLDVEELSSYQMQFHEAFLMLIDIYYVKSQYPPDEVFKKYTSDEREQFRCYRIDVQDTIMYLHNALRERYLHYFTEKLNVLISDTTPSSWQQTEALLFLLSGTCGMIDIEEEVYIPKLISLMHKIPDHPKIKNTLVSFIGGLGDWLNHHPTQIPNVLPYLLTGFLNTETSSSCSLSLKDICQDCAKLLDKQSIGLILQTCHQGLQCTKTSAKVMVRLFEICGFVISVLPPHRMNEELEKIVTPLLQLLQSVLQANHSGSLNIDRICQYLNCLHGLYRGLDPFEELPVHPITYVYAQMLQVFPLLKPWCGVENVVVAATKCIGKAVEIVREKLSNYTGVTCELIFDIFTVHPSSCLLETAALLIGMFGSVEQTMEITKNFFSGLLNNGLALLSSGNKYTDCMQSLMYLLTRTIKTVPEFVYCNVERQVEFLKCSLVLLTFQETPTVKSTCTFLVTYINHSSVYESGKQLLVSFGQELLCQVLVCIGSTAPRHLTDYYAEVVLALNKNNVTQLAIWLKEVFSKENFPTKYPTVAQKEQFQKAILRGKMSKSSTKEIVKDFALVCRGLQGMAYVS